LRTTGYNLLGGETTANDTDWREQLDLSTPHPVPSPEEPLYHNLLAPIQWPSPDLTPDFRPTYEAYIAQMSKLSISFTSLIAEALDLSPTAFDRFFDKDQQHKLKIIKYPDAGELGSSGSEGPETSNRLNGTHTNGVNGSHASPNGIPPGWRQGVGPHKDSMLTSYLLQATHHAGLQAQNLNGEWIDVSPIDGTLVVAIGQGLEALTQGVCASTTHRVLSPPAGAGARLSVPFFQGVSYDATFESVDVPESVRNEKRKMMEREGGKRLDDVEFTFVKGKFQHLGEATLYNRAKSHPDVAQRWYPELWKEICRDREEAERAKREAEKAEALPKANVGIEAH
jgi:isopenicillin N synthase-like dioxygenase